MQKHLPAYLFRDQADYSHQRWFAVLPPAVTFADLFMPSLWAHYANGKFKKWDTVRVVAEDSSFDIDLTVAEITAGGCHMKVRPFFGEASSDAAIAKAKAEAAKAAVKVVPLAKDGKPVVRTEYLAATKWRVVGLNGEVSRDHETEAAAKKALAKYLREADLTMPPDAAPAATPAATQSPAKATA